MSVVEPPVELAIALPRAQVLGVLGYPQGYAPSPGVERLLDPLIAEARALVRARGAWRRLRPEQAAQVGLDPIAADALVIGLVTAGGELEQAAAERLERGEATAALVLEACGSAAAEEAADRLGARIVQQLAAEAGSREPPPRASSTSAAAHIGCRVSPGYARWPITSQRQLFARLPHAALGMHLEESFLMVPRKSISFAMWPGAEARPTAGLSGCARCELDGCRFRRVPRRTG